MLTIANSGEDRIVHDLMSTIAYYAKGLCY